MNLSRKTAVLAAAVGSSVVLGAGPALAAAPSLTINPAGVLDAPGRNVTLTGTLRCDPVPPGGHQYLMLKVYQSPPLSAAQAQREFDVTASCIGVVVPYSFTLPVISSSRLLPGAATAQGLLHGSVGAVAATVPVVLA